MEVANKLADALRSTAAMVALTKNVVTNATDAVIVGMGAEPWDGEFSIDELEGMGCWLMVEPAEDAWLQTNESEASTGMTDELFSYQLFLRRQVLESEINNVFKDKIYLWFWSQCAALPGQTRVAAAPCVLLKQFDGVEPPAWNTDPEEAGQGAILHASFLVTVGDV